jgi:hypothetical protein
VENDPVRLLAKVQPFIQAGVRLVWVQTPFGVMSVRARDDRPITEWEIGDIHAGSGVTLGQFEALWR